MIPYVALGQLSPLRATYAKELASEPRPGSLTIMEADYYEVTLAEKFDLVCHWDSFGMGADEDQRRLLQRIAEIWLATGGCVLMDIFSLWWCARQAGKVEIDEEFGLTQRYDFDPTGCRFIDQWWPTADQSQFIAQSARCYTPVDLTLLVKGVCPELEQKVGRGHSPKEPYSFAECWEELFRTSIHVSSPLPILLG